MSPLPGVWHGKPSVDVNDDGSVYIRSQASTVFVTSEEIAGLIADLAKAQSTTLDRVLSEMNTAPIRRKAR